MNNSRLGNWSHYDIYFANTPNGVRAAGRAVICLDLLYPDENVQTVALEEFAKLQNSLADSLHIATHYSQPWEFSIKVWGERLPILQLRNYEPPSELKPYVEQGKLRFSFMAVDPVCIFLIHIVQTSKVLYEIVRPDLLIVRDETNTYFSIFNTWDYEAEEEGWEYSAYD